MSSSSSSAPRPPLDDLPALSHLSPCDRELFFQFGVGPHRTVPFPLVHHAFEVHAQAQPDVVAVEHKTFEFEKEITYGELDNGANRLARRLNEDYAVGLPFVRIQEPFGTLEEQRRFEQRAQPRVCVVAKRSVEFVVAILAVLKSGAQYVPVDGVTVTDKTLLHILRDAKPKVVLCMQEYADRVEEALNAIRLENETVQGDNSVPSMVRLEAAIQEDARLGRDASKPQESTRPTDGCYVIYTSGTTGTPKGVDVCHDGVTNVICGPPGNLSMRPGQRVAQLLNIAFDMGAWEILASLYNGCTLCLRGNSSKEWIRLMKSVDVVISTPSVLARHDPREYAGRLRAVIVGGEVCSQDLADSWTSAGIAFHNCCGPTEISICNTIQPHAQPGYPLSIGRPIPNTSVYILDPDWVHPSLVGKDGSSSPVVPDASFSKDISTDALPRAVPIGTPGIMYVGGIGVSRGYLNLPAQNRSRFLPDPFRHGEPGAVMFNTGDLGCWRKEDGQLDHLGRVDEQVKVKGFRVELDGVGVAMREGYRPLVQPDNGRNVDGSGRGQGQLHVSSAVALLMANELWGFLTPLGIDLPLVKEGTRRVQPYYAVPTRWVVMDGFPMTRNGKVDKRRLKDIAIGVMESEDATNGGSEMSKTGVEVTLDAFNNANGSGVENNMMMMTTTPGTSRATTPLTPNSLPTTPMPMPLSNAMCRSVVPRASMNSFLRMDSSSGDMEKALSPPFMLQVPPVGRQAQRLMRGHEQREGQDEGEVHMQDHCQLTQPAHPAQPSLPTQTPRSHWSQEYDVASPQPHLRSVQMEC